MAEDSLSWTSLEARVAYSCDGFDVVNERVHLPDGTTTDFDYLTEPETVGIVPLTADGTVVLIEEWRHAVGRVNHGIPAGTVEPADASPRAAARRELEEETGYVTDDLTHLCTVEPANGVADTVHHLFVARCCEPTGTQRLDHDESIRVSPEPWVELLARVRRGEVRDGRTALAVAQVALSGELD